MVLRQVSNSVQIVRKDQLLIGPVSLSLLSMNKQPCILVRLEGGELNHNPVYQSSPALLSRSDTASPKSEVSQKSGI